MSHRILVLALAIVAFVAAPVGAQTDAPEDYDGTNGETEVDEDGTIRLTGEGCEPGATVDYEVTRNGEPFTSGTTTADDDGRFEVVVETSDPAGVDIEYRLDAKCEDRTVVLGSTTDRAPRVQTSTLARTGADDPFGLAQYGVLLVVVGAIAVHVSRNRTADA